MPMLFFIASRSVVTAASIAPLRSARRFWMVASCSASRSTSLSVWSLLTAETMASLSSFESVITMTVKWLTEGLLLRCSLSFRLARRARGRLGSFRSFRCGRSDLRGRRRSLWSRGFENFADAVSRSRGRRSEDRGAEVLDLGAALLTRRNDDVASLADDDAEEERAADGVRRRQLLLEGLLGHSKRARAMYTGLGTRHALYSFFMASFATVQRDPTNRIMVAVRLQAARTTRVSILEAFPRPLSISLFSSKPLDVSAL